MDTRSNLDSKVAIVTGSSRGIGYAIARAHAGAGARIVVTARRQEPRRSLPSRVELRPSKPRK
jgi:NAD(P)-dependent dehydrogenase (short-subunit alcohol dehydrogenase family)